MDNELFFFFDGTRKSAYEIVAFSGGKVAHSGNNNEVSEFCLYVDGKLTQVAPGSYIRVQRTVVDSKEVTKNTVQNTPFESAAAKEVEIPAEPEEEEEVSEESKVDAEDVPEITKPAAAPVSKGKKK